MSEHVQLRELLQGPTNESPGNAPTTALQKFASEAASSLYNDITAASEPEQIELLTPEIL